MVVGVTIVVPLVIICEFFAPLLVSIFNNEPDVIYAGTNIIRIVLLAFIPMAVSAIVGSAFWGAGDTTPPMMIGVLDMWLIQLPLIWLVVTFAKQPVVRALVTAGMPDPVYNAWIPVIIGETIAAVAILLVFKLGLWKKNLVSQMANSS